MRRLILAAAALSLASCGAMTTAPPATSPPPATTPSAGEAAACAASGNREFCLAYSTFDTLLSLVDLYRAARPGFDGTAQARQLADLIDKVQTALNTASAIQRGLRSGDYLAALGEATAGIRQIQTLLGR